MRFQVQVQVHLVAPLVVGAWVILVSAIGVQRVGKRQQEVGGARAVASLCQQEVFREAKGSKRGVGAEVWDACREGCGRHAGVGAAYCQQ